MSGICLAIDTNKDHALNELVKNHLQSEKQLDLLTESAHSGGLITEPAYELIKRSIGDKDPYSLLKMATGEHLQKLNELALIKLNMWTGRKSLNVVIKPHHFHPNLNNEVERYAKEWTPSSGITFNFNTVPADIIIEINGRGIHWSYIGREAIPFSAQGQTTMHLGIGYARTPEQIRRPVIHEFGHALGCIHEHQSPASPIQWNEAAAFKEYAKGGWDEATVRANVFAKFSFATITNSEFDKHSIMLYPIDRSLTKDGFSAPWNTELSVLDKSFIQKAYSIV